MARKTARKLNTRQRTSRQARPSRKSAAKPHASATRKSKRSATPKNRSSKRTKAPIRPVKPVAARPDGKAVRGEQAKPARSRGKAQPAVPATGKAAGQAGTVAKGGKKGKTGKSVAEAASTITADHKGYVFINGRRVRMISTRNHAAVRKPRGDSAAASESAPAASAEPPKPIKSPLARKELNHYRELLLQKRRELVGDLHAMENEALRSGGGNLSHMPIHMADIGTDTFDQDFMLGLAEAERQQLREIDGALERIQNGTFGVCVHTGQPIPKARLDVKPYAKYTVEAARLLESQWGK